MVHKCSCKHPQQDKIHGKNMRVFNLAKCEAHGQVKGRCTVCKKEEYIPEGQWK